MLQNGLHMTSLKSIHTFTVNKSATPWPHLMYSPGTCSCNRTNSKQNELLDMANDSIRTCFGFAGGYWILLEQNIIN